MLYGFKVDSIHPYECVLGNFIALQVNFKFASLDPKFLRLAECSIAGYLGTADVEMVGAYTNFTRERIKSLTA